MREEEKGALRGNVFALNPEELDALKKTKFFTVENYSVKVFPLRTEDRRVLATLKELYDEAHGLPIPSTLHISQLRDRTQQIDKPLEMSISIANSGGRDEVLERVQVYLDGRFTKRIAYIHGIRKGQALVVPWETGEKRTIRITITPPDMPRAERLLVTLFFNGRQCVKHGAGISWMSSSSVVALQESGHKRRLHSGPIDNVVRDLIPAFGPGRPTPSHLHTKAHTAWVNKLQKWEIPSEIRKDIVDVGRDYYTRLKGWNTKDNYKRRLHELLWVEEAKRVYEFRSHDLRSISIEGPISSYKDGNHTKYPEESYPVMRIPVPGLHEGRPSLLRGDRLYCWAVGTEDVEYEGWVTVVERDSVLVMLVLDFHQRFDLKSIKFNARFEFPRLLFREMHTAVETVDTSVVHPSHDLYLRTREQPTLPDAFHSEVALNNEQKNLIARVIAGSPGTPVTCNGAFGTGKSHCLVACCKYLLLHDPSSRILFCTEANGAADLVAKSLVEDEDLQPYTDMMLRQYAFRYNENRIPPVCKRIVHVWRDNEIDYPTIGDVDKYRLVISTAHASCVFHGIGVGKNHWTHIIIDEAAQMMEAKALLPLTMAGPTTTIVFAGDVKQVGPKMQSISAEERGLQLSILERQFPAHQYNLFDNYRNHPLILQWPSRWFYDGKLRATKPAKALDKRWKKVLPTLDCPVVFAAVNGMECKDPDSPSLYNHIEADYLCGLVESIVHKHKLVPPRDLSVVAPYRRHLEKIREMLRQRGLGSVDVGPLDSMQGKEKRVIIISAVRSRRVEGCTYYENAAIGFVNEPRRLNTAMTRAIELLVVVGDPLTLCHDPHFSEYMRFCKERGSTLGESLSAEPPNDRVATEPVERMDATCSPRSPMKEAVRNGGVPSDIKAHDRMDVAMTSTAHDTTHGVNGVRRALVVEEPPAPTERWGGTSGSRGTVRVNDAAGMAPAHHPATAIRGVPYHQGATEHKRNGFEGGQYNGGAAGMVPPHPAAFGTHGAMYAPPRYFTGEYAAPAQQWGTGERGPPGVGVRGVDYMHYQGAPNMSHSLPPSFMPSLTAYTPMHAAVGGMGTSVERGHLQDGIRRDVPQAANVDDGYASRGAPGDEGEWERKGGKFDVICALHDSTLVEQTSGTEPIGVVVCCTRDELTISLFCPLMQKRSVSKKGTMIMIRLAPVEKGHYLSFGGAVEQRTKVVDVRVSIPGDTIYNEAVVEEGPDGMCLYIKVPITPHERKVAVSKARGKRLKIEHS